MPRPKPPAFPEHEDIRFQELVKARLDALSGDLLKVYQTCVANQREGECVVLQQVGVVMQRAEETDACDKSADPALQGALLGENEDICELAKLPIPERWLCLADKYTEHKSKRSTSQGLVVSAGWLKGKEDIAEDIIYHKHAAVAEDMNVFRAGDVLTDDNQLCKMFAINPHGRRFLLWSFLGMLCVLWDIAIIPMQACELGALVPMADDVGRVVFGYWCVDLLINFFIGIDEGSGLVDMRAHKMIARYAKSWFVLDLFLVLMDVCMAMMTAISAGTTNSIESMRVARALRVVRFARLLRLRTFTATVDVLLARLRSEYWVVILKIAQLTFKMFVVVHYIACFWYYLTTLEEANNWRTPFEADMASMGAAYVMAVHWSLTQFSPATNNIAPVTFYERVFAIFIVFYAFIAFSSFVSAMTNAVNELQSINAERAQAQTAIRRYFYDKQISTDLWCRVTTFCSSKGLHEKRLKESDIPAMQEIPESLRVRLHEELYLPSLQESRIMTVLEVNDSSRQLMSKLCHFSATEETYNPRQDIFVEGGEAYFMYTLHRGIATYSSSFLNKPVHALGSLGPSQFDPDLATDSQMFKADLFFSELALWTAWRHRGQLVSLTTCNWIKFDCAIFTSLVRKHGGQSFSLLSMLGNLAVSYLEESDESVESDTQVTTDLGLTDEMMHQLSCRAASFVKLSSDSRSFVNTATASFTRERKSRWARR